MEKNDVSSFFYYMWNHWSKAECEIVFPDPYAKQYELPNHFWNKWCGFCDLYGPAKAIEPFYAGLSEGNRDRLVSRAVFLYDRGKYTQNHPNFKDK